MSESNRKTYIVNVKDLSFKSEQMVLDLIRYLAEQIPQIEIKRAGSELEVSAPKSMSKRTIRLRIRKFLYKKELIDDYRAISLQDPDKEGYTIKERRVYQFTYY
ncbi:MAG: hypothetical protein EU544_01960 [Promethearchaeota archaeon]|nr:MAG: hypothetical protein EU544_01960 [Candidatus Lokiarchaeota archaeon]